MWEGDWIQTKAFKDFIKGLLAQGYRFISLSDAYEHLQLDFFRRNKYAVLTFDDGLASIEELMPWLAELGIPVTLFVNTSVLSSQTLREKPMNLLTTSSLERLATQFHPLISIGNHGLCHVSVTELSISEFKDSITDSETFLSKYPQQIPFFSYPYGDHTEETDNVLRECRLVPVLCDGNKNYNDPLVIHRELLKG